MKTLSTKLFVLFLALLCANSAFGQKKDSEQKELEGIRAELIVQVDAAERKFISLAETIPQEKYSWRPAKDVRSVSEVLMHVAFGNYLIAGFSGAKTPEGLSSGGMEKITDRKEVVRNLKESFEFVRQAIKNTKPENLGDDVDFFSRKTTKRGVLYFTTIHFSQHLGQLIAYSRINGITPPWSEG